MTGTRTSSTTIGIGLPVYNGARFLAATLDSILAQTHEQFELAVSDNGSTDETEEICRDYVRRDPRLRYLRRDVNRGAAWNYNSLVHETTGPYFKWASHDDVLAPTYLERCLQVMRRLPTVSVVYPRTAGSTRTETWMARSPAMSTCGSRRRTRRLASLAKSFVLGNSAFGLMRRDMLERTHLLAPSPPPTSSCSPS